MAAVPQEVLAPSSIRFYRQALSILADAGVPHLVGGAYALARYTGIERHTKDFDIFIRRDDFRRAAWAFQKAGYRTELTFPHWLGKAYRNDEFIDLIFSAGNGVAVVDEEWFAHSMPDTVFGVPARLAPPEEMIWSKGTIMERERYDGADVAHLIRALGEKLDWRRIVVRFGPYWRTLYAHIILFGFVYPSDRGKVPEWVVDEMVRRMQQERDGKPSSRVCYGTILSRQQYLKDVNDWGYEDARLVHRTMSDDDIAHWTAGIAVDGADQ